MNDKEFFEWHFINRFKQIYHGFPNGTIEKWEHPDLLVKNENEITGLEISLITNKTSPGESYPPIERNSNESRIINEAERIFKLSSKIPLHIHFEFFNKYSLNKKEKAILSQEICELVLKSIEGIDEKEIFHIDIPGDLPYPLSFAGISYYPGLKQSSWYSVVNGFLQKLSSSQIIEQISDKESDFKNYGLSKVILLLIEGIPPGSWFDKIEIPPKDEISCSFSKVFILRNLFNELIELK